MISRVVQKELHRLVLQLSKIDERDWRHGHCKDCGLQATPNL